MIEAAGLDQRATLAGAGTCLATIMGAEADQLALAAHWADLHDPTSLPPPTTDVEARRRRFDQDYGVRPGGEGTPEVLKSCFAELGVVLQTSAGGAKYLVGDAWDPSTGSGRSLRHRLPELWAEVQSGRVRGWKARKVAQATRHLPLAAMTQVDLGLSGLLTSLPWSRFEAVLEATVMRADPAGAAHTEAEAGSRRFVSLGLDGGRGLKTVIARGEVLDILTFLAAVNRIADILEVEGDPDTVEVRRSKAVGILGQPDRALALLTRHQHDEPCPSMGPSADDRTDTDESDVDGTEPEREPEETGSRSIDLSRPGPEGNTPVASVRVQLYVHLTAHTVRRWLGRPDVKVTVRPVAVPGAAVPADGYEIPRGTREAVLLRNPASVFPWSWCTDRDAVQLDHVRAYLARRRGGQPGQTAPENLAPLAGAEHQRKTSGRWQERAPAPGVFLWRSPHGWVELVTNQGTFPLGHGATARAMWHAAAPVQTDLEAAA